MRRAFALDRAYVGCVAGDVRMDRGTSADDPGQPRVNLREWARSNKRDIIAIYLAARDPRVPWYAKALALAVAAYALSPIDLIPDFIPIIGYLDDLIIVPAGIALVRRLIPATLMTEHRHAADAISQRPTSKTAAFIIVLVWVAAVALSAHFVLATYRGRSKP